MASHLLILIALLPAGTLGDVSTVKDLAVLEGRSVTIPCHYEPQYSRNVKYWCRGSMHSFCSNLARTDTAPATDSKVSITDHPAQQVFTVTMSDLQEGDSDRYWCGVEVGNMWRADDVASVYITVTHGMAVVSSMVSGEEGGSVTVQCLYSSKHRKSVKSWCRSGDWGSCVVADSNGSADRSRVQLSDDGVGELTVTVQRLESGDAGWYWCTAGQQQVSVHITVTPPSATQRTVTTSLPLMTSLPEEPPVLRTSAPPTRDVQKDSEGPNSLGHVFEIPILICMSVLLLAIVVMVPWKMWSHCQKRRKRRDITDETEQALTLSRPCSDSKSDQTKAAVIFFNSSPQQVQMF